MKTNLEVLNEISEKLGGQGNATSVTESLNNIANALGDTNPDVIKSVSDSLEDILEYAGGGGGSVDIQPKLTITIDNSASYSPINVVVWELDGNNIKQSPIEISARETETIETLILGLFDEDEMECFYELNKSEFMDGGKIGSIDNLVNCEADGTSSVVITDPSQPASCTFVMQYVI